MDKCRADVRVPGLNFTRMRQCSKRAMENGYCVQHDPDRRAAKEQRTRRILTLEREQREMQREYDRTAHRIAQNCVNGEPLSHALKRTYQRLLTAIADHRAELETLKGTKP